MPTTPILRTNEQRRHDAADSAGFLEAGYFAQIADDPDPAARYKAAIGRYRSDAAPLACPMPDERDLIGRSGISHIDGVHHYAQRRYDQLYDAIVRAWAAAKRSH